MSLKIVVMSCDKNKDLWFPFYHCMEKYWKNHPEIIYSTEELTNQYYKTIKGKFIANKWTDRLLYTIKTLNCYNVLIMVDDIFIREYVDNELIISLQQYINDNVASINLEKCFDPYDKPFNDLLMQRSTLGRYKTSVMCNMFNREKLVKILKNIHTDPWEFERINNHMNFTYLIARNKCFINFGYEYRNWFGIRKGKWCLETRDFFNKEGIEIDYSIRGFYK